MEILTIILNTTLENWQIIIAFFIIAIVYSSVGFGGGSSYLAVLSLWGLPFIQVRFLALICNITVVSGNIFGFIKRKEIHWKKVLPLVLMSIPLAFLGGKMDINQGYFTITLALTLITAAIIMLYSQQVNKPSKKDKTYKLTDLGFGGSIGFLAGMVGIGGGIFLAPLLHLTKWDTPKKIAATTSLFIFVNSIAGLMGQSQNNLFSFDPYLTTILVCTVFIGGQIGDHLQAKIISPILLKKMTAILILLVGFKLLINQFI